MLTIEKIDDLLNVPIKCEDGRLIRLMSCDNILKRIFLYYSHEFSSNKDFDSQLKNVILKFSETVHYILENPNNIDRKKIVFVNEFTILPTKEIIKNAILEIKTWHNVLDEALKSLSTLDFNVEKLSMINYIVLANFCQISDFSKDINSSRILRRFINFQNQVKNYYTHKISTGIFLEEVKNHKEYIESMNKIYNDFNLKEEDLLTFMLLFDIRKNRNMLTKNKKT